MHYLLVQTSVLYSLLAQHFNIVDAWPPELDQYFLSVVIGLLVGIVIGRSTEYYTSQSYKPTRKLAESGKTGPATVIISGVGLGMVSTAVPVLAVVVGIILSYWLAAGYDFSNVGMGLLWHWNCCSGNAFNSRHPLATDAYGPIAEQCRW